MMIEEVTLATNLLRGQTRHTIMKIEVDVQMRLCLHMIPHLVPREERDLPLPNMTVWILSPLVETCRILRGWIIVGSYRAVKLSAPESLILFGIFRWAIPQRQMTPNPLTLPHRVLYENGWTFQMNLALKEPCLPPGNIAQPWKGSQSLTSDTPPLF
ncbi:unnamed protein product [Brassica oleracea var. botrytis]